MDTIINALTDSRYMSVGFPSQGFFADNGGKFVNIKLDELTSKLRLTVRFGPSYSPWPISLNERNHASADITIKNSWKSKKCLFLIPESRQLRGLTILQLTT